MLKKLIKTKEFKQLLTDPKLSKRELLLGGIALVVWTLLPVDDLIGLGIGAATGPFAGIFAPLLAWGDEVFLWPWFLNAVRKHFMAN